MIEVLSGRGIVSRGHGVGVIPQQGAPPFAATDRFISKTRPTRALVPFLRLVRGIGFLLWSFFICCILAGFAIEYDLLPRTSEQSLAESRPLIDYFYYEIMTFTTVGYGDIVPRSVQGKLLAICTALLGFTHGVTFVALVLQALTQHLPANSKE